MKDITVTTFGLVIAYLLPGLIGLYGLSFWSPALRASFSAFPTTASNVGLFFIVVLASLVIGMIAHGIRWIVFEVWFGKPTQTLGPDDFARLSGERKMDAFRGAVDEIYRYHQWWGGMAVVGPILLFGWLSQNELTRPMVISAIVAFAIVEMLATYAAVRIRELYVNRVKAILKGEQQ